MGESLSMAAFGQAVKMLYRRQNTATNANNDPNISSATNSDKNNPSASQLLSTLVPVFVVALVWFTIFILIRPRASWKYSPRSQSKLLSQNAYTPALKKGYFDWIPQMWAIPDTWVLTHQSLDSYLFLRFLRMAIVSTVVGCIITFPILFPVNATGGGVAQQLDIITLSNVISPWRFWAHAIVAWIYFGFVMFLITRESIFYINLRQAYLMNPAYTRKLSSRTVLFTSVPDEYLHETALRSILGNSVVRIWFPTETDDLEELVDERQKIASKLEAAESKLVKMANDARLKSVKKSQKGNKKSKDGEVTHIDSTAGLSTADTETGNVSSQWIKPKDRPTHRLKFLVGKKVDTIDWSRSELQTLMPKIDAEQQKHRQGQEVKKLRAAFVEFDTLREAQAAYQSLTHHSILTMAPRYTGMHPSDVIWSNLKIQGWQRYLRFALSLAFVIALIIFWSIPVAVVGAISNITYLTDMVPFLRFILSIPRPILGVVTGLLPSVMLAVLMALLPPVLRLAAILGGAPTYSDAEYTLQNYYFAFQVVQVFLVTTLSSAASSAVTSIIANPASVTTLLSTSLPKASNFFISYIILQGLGVVASILVGLAGLFITPLLVRFLGNTPKKVFDKWNRLATVSWGVVYPIYTNLWVIAICYAVIAPLVQLFAAIGLFFFYFAFRYNFLFVFDTGIDEKGLGYARALQQLFVGLYLAEICLLGLFAVRLDNVGAIGPFVLMILLIIFTALYQVSLNSAIGPLLDFLPKTLEAEESKALLAQKDDAAIAEKNGEYGGDLADAENGIAAKDGPVPSALNDPAHPAPKNFLVKFLKPHIYNDYRTMRRLVPTMVEHDDDDEVIRELKDDAYHPPSVWREMPTLLIPRDTMGVSAQEVNDTRKFGVPIHDDAATLNEKGKIEVDDVKMAEYHFATREQRLKNAPSFSQSLAN